MRSCCFVCVWLLFVSCAFHLDSPVETVKFYYTSIEKKELDRANDCLRMYDAGGTRVKIMQKDLRKEWRDYRIKKVIFYDEEKVYKMKKRLKMGSDVYNYPARGDVGIIVTELYENNKSQDFWFLLRKFGDKWLIVESCGVGEP